MSLAYVILGLLQQQDRTGYDLKTECFDQGIAHLWPADQAQIYRTLDKLEAQGWLACSVEIQHDRPNRKIYRLTEAGTAELTRWLQTPQPLPILRDPLLAQLHFAAQLSDEAILHLLEQQLEARRAKLDQCQHLCRWGGLDGEVDAIANLPTAREQQLQQWTVDLVMQREQVYLDWLQTTIAAIRHASTCAED